MWERIKTKPGYKYLATLIALLTAMYLLYINDPATQVANGSKILVCETRNGVFVIPPSKHPVYIDEEDVWGWQGGYSHNCWLEDPVK